MVNKRAREQDRKEVQSPMASSWWDKEKDRVGYNKELERSFFLIL